MEPRLLTVKETAAYIGLHEMTVRDLIYRGELEFVRIGRAIRIDKLVLDEWIDSHSQIIEKAPPKC